MSRPAVFIRRARPLSLCLHGGVIRLACLALCVAGVLAAVSNPPSVARASALPGLQPAVRLAVSPVAPPKATLDRTTAEQLTSISVRTQSCTATWIGSSLVTASHCYPGTGFRSTGDIAVSGAEVAWADPGLIPDGALVFMVAFPRAVPTAQSFVLASLGPQVLPGGQNVLMTVGSGVPCGPGSSGAVGWLSVDNTLTPIGPLSVYSVDPSVTGLPSGQFVCGFAVDGE